MTESGAPAAGGDVASAGGAPAPGADVAHAGGSPARGGDAAHAGGAPALDVFALRDRVVGEYKRFATSFATIHARDIREQVGAIYAEKRYWPEPLIQINPSYKRTTDVGALVSKGVVDPGCADIFRAEDGAPLSLYKHQEQAVALAAAGESFVVTTGTGSGKSLCFFIPIVSHVLVARRRSAEPRTHAIVVYPMNALANSQLEELAKFIGQAPGDRPVTFDRYTGQEDDDERKRVAEQPPDILLTNFMMLEMLMTRQDETDRRVIGNCEGLRFLVLDELHTYRGRQGADVVLLARRVRERLQPEHLLCIGTSATMASEGSVGDRNRVVAGVASKLFGSAIGESNVITETLERITAPTATADSVQPKLGEAIDAGVPADITDAALMAHPLAVWVETRLGIAFACVLFRLGGGLTDDTDDSGSRQNAFFRDLYENMAEMLRAPTHPLFGFEAREHTAQVDPDNRWIREKRFRFGQKEQDELAKDEKRLREAGETNRFLPVLFCSPTMELGVDISALNAVHMRNVPPTPANYAQRGGRAGRNGQAALVLAYASSQSPHDQYFFRDPRAMVHGEVRAPVLELTNRDLIDSHLQAVWLSCVDEALDNCIANLLLLNDAGRPLDPDIASALVRQRVAEQAGGRIRRVLDLVADELTPESAPWYTGRDAYADAIVASAAGRFDAAFNRWRDLFAAAEEQRDAARRTMDDYSTSYREKKAAQARHAQAVDQLDLLQRGASALSSDFYTYRYLATEGFLPGYNFPRLPLFAYIPASRDGRGRQTYLQRPRFLALAEFGPRSLVYHEGRAHRVVRALLSLGRQESAAPDAQLPTQAVRICTHCGGGHFGDDVSMCHACGTSLGDAEVVGNTYRIENVATQPAEQITANDEERQRQGFDLQTTFEWAVRDREVDVRQAVASDDEGEIVRLSYGAGATITRLNKGLRRRADKKVLGFPIDPVSGYWARSDDEDADEGPTDPTAAPRQRIVPSVQDRKNALLFQPAGDAPSAVTLATVQHAVLRGIEAVFQLEPGEMLAEPMPTRDSRHGFLLYEATEGGAGVLTRLVSQETSLATVARTALEIMHLSVEADLPRSVSDLADQPDAACVAACYRCLMSYYNQPDHELLDRRDEDARNLLLRLAGARTVETTGTQPGGDPLVLVAEGARSDSRTSQATLIVSGGESREERWLAAAARRGIPAPDSEPFAAGGRSVRRVWRKHYVAALVDEADGPALPALEDLGFEVVRFEDPAGWRAAFARPAAVLGQGSSGESSEPRGGSSAGIRVRVSTWNQSHPPLRKRTHNVDHFNNSGSLKAQRFGVSGAELPRSPSS